MIIHVQMCPQEAAAGFLSSSFSSFSMRIYKESQISRRWWVCEIVSSPTCEDCQMTARIWERIHQLDIMQQGKNISFPLKPANKLCCFVGVLQELCITPEKVTHYKVVLMSITIWDNKMWIFPSCHFMCFECLTSSIWSDGNDYNIPVFF